MNIVRLTFKWLFILLVLPNILLISAGAVLWLLGVEV